MEYTPNYNLKKPGGEDYYNIQDFNDNADSIDTALAELFTSVSNGKTALVADIEGKGGTVEQAGDVPTFGELSGGIQSIPSGGGDVDPNQEFTMPVLNVNTSYRGVDGIKLRWTPPPCDGQRIAYKKNALPDLPITSNFVDVSANTREYNLTGLDLDTPYGLWVLTKNADGTFQTAKPVNNRKMFKTNGFLDNTVLEVNLPTELSAATTLYVFRTKTGDTYISGNNASALGIYKLNTTTQLWEQVYASSHSWQYWFEASDGRVFVSSSVSSTGIVSGTGSTMTQVYATSQNWQYWFESSSGEVFIGGGGTGTGIRKWDGSTFISVYSTSQLWQHWFESSAGEVFVSGTSTGTGILKWNGTNFIQIYSSSHNWLYWFESSNGDVFVSSSQSSTGILKWDGTTFKSVYASGSGWLYWFESSSGEVFVSGSSAGILKWNGSIFEQVYPSNTNWQFWFEGSASDIFVSSTTSGTGILKWDGSMFVQVYSLDYNHRYWFEDASGNIFVSLNVANTGILKWNGTTFVQVYVTGGSRNWGVWFQSSDDELFVSSNVEVAPGTLGILKWNGTAFTRIFTTGYNYDYIHETATEIIFISTLATSYPFAIYNKATGAITASGTMYGGLLFGILPRFLNNTNKKLYTLEDSFSFLGSYTAVTNNPSNYAYAVSTDRNYILLNF